MDKLLECLSIALDLDNEDSLNRYHTGSMHVSSLIHYPAVSTQRLRSGEVIRNAAHSDLGTLTLLFQHNVGGLEIADMSSTDKITTTAVEKDANFIAIDPKPGTIVVNVGYLLMRWTNGRWKNVVHRVVQPANSISKWSSEERVDFDETTPDRYSVAFFGFPDAATIVEPLPSCCSTDMPKRWGPINAGEYLLKKRAALYS
jgi:isopenicillin N synthase-like dioxygenase